VPLTVKAIESELGCCVPARKLFIFAVEGQTPSDIVISTKKVKTCFYISIIINSVKKILRM
jgi:hypothetical protein